MESSLLLKFQLRLFQAMGMLRAKDSSCFITLWCIIVLLWSGIILVCCQFISVFYVETTNQLVEELILLCTTSSIAIKLALFQIRRKHSPNILNILEKLDKRIKSIDDVSTLQTALNYCRRASGVYFVLYIGSIVALVFQLIFLNRDERTWKSTALVPTEFAQQPSVYYSVLVIQAIGNILNCVAALTLDSYCFILIGFLSGHIDVLAINLLQIGTMKNELKHGSKLLHLMKHLKHYNLLIEYVRSQIKSNPTN